MPIASDIIEEFSPGVKENPKHFQKKTNRRISTGKMVFWQIRIWRRQSRAAPAGGRLPLRGRWTGRSPGRMRGKTLSWERVAGRSPDGCGAVRTRTRYRPSSGPCGATFPQGKVGGRLLTAPAGFPIHLGPVFWEGWVPLIRQGLWPCHLPRRGRRPPGGGFSTSALPNSHFPHLSKIS